MIMTEPGVVRIADQGMRAPVDIPGRLIGTGTSETDDSLAWAVIEIYALHEGGYMTHRIGYSLRYHREDTSCMTRKQTPKGEPCLVADLPEDAEPCPVCRPLPMARLLNSTTVRMEFPRHTFDSCKDPVMAIDRLTVIRHRDGRPPSVRFSQPVMDALNEAASNDDGFARVRERWVSI